MTTAAAITGRTAVYQEPNPMDPWDPLKRWYAALWPAQRVGVWLCCAAVTAAVAVWVTR